MKSPTVVVASAPPEGSRQTLRAVARHAFAVAAAGIGLFSISVSVFGGDLPTGYATTMAVPLQPTSLGRRPLFDHPVDPPGVAPDGAARHARRVDQLYEKLMRQTAPGCRSATNRAAMEGGC